MEKVNTQFINGTRFILALWVALGHFYLYLGDTNFIYIPLLSEFLQSPIIAVDGFIIITGFLMFYTYTLKSKKESPYLKSTRINFWKDRFFRIYPLYILMIIIGCFIFNTKMSLLMEINSFFSSVPNNTNFGAGNSSPGILEFISHIFLLQGLIPSHTAYILGVTWSLSLEAQFYFLFPILFLFLFKDENTAQSRLLVTYFAAIFLSAVTVYLGVDLGYPYPSIIINKLPMFILGMILAATSLKKINYGYLALAIILFSPFLDLLQCTVFGFITLFINIYHLKKYLPKSAFKILDTINNMLSNKFSKFGADISYALYLIHDTIFVIVLKFFIEYVPLNIYLLALLALPCYLIICLLVGFLLHSFIEKPFIKLGKKIKYIETKIKLEKELEI